MPAPKIKYDLHLHTCESDGVLSPEALVDRAILNQVDCIAITDHDTTNGVLAAQNHIIAQQYPLRCIAGVEISTQWRSHEIHVVGLNVDLNSDALQTLLTAQRQQRQDRAEKIGAKLDRNGLTNSFAKAQAIAKGAVSRPHFAQLLIQEGAVDSMEKAFKRYLSQKGCAYVASDWVLLESAIVAIQAANGVAVLAHPFRYRLNTASVKRLIRDFKLAGGNGIEVGQGRQSQNEFQLLTRLAREFELSASQGSDFHALSDHSDVGRCLQIPDHLTPIWQHWTQ